MKVLLQFLCSVSGFWWILGWPSLHGCMLDWGWGVSYYSSPKSWGTHQSTPVRYRVQVLLHEARPWIDGLDGEREVVGYEREEAKGTWLPKVSSNHHVSRWTMSLLSFFVWLGPWTLRPGLTLSSPKCESKVWLNRSTCSWVKGVLFEYIFSK